MWNLWIVQILTNVDSKTVDANTNALTHWADSNVFVRPDSFWPVIKEVALMLTNAITIILATKRVWTHRAVTNVHVQRDIVYMDSDIAEVGRICCLSLQDAGALFVIDYSISFTLSRLALDRLCKSVSCVNIPSGKRRRCSSSFCFSSIFHNNWARKRIVC